MTDPFEFDPYPGKPKILFIGQGRSIDTQAWIDLLSGAELNVRLFSIPGGGLPPSEWKTRAYICSPSSQLPDDLDPVTRQSLYPLPRMIKFHKQQIKLFDKELDEKRIALRGNIIFLFSALAKVIINFLGKRFGMPILYHAYYPYHDFKMSTLNTSQVNYPEEWLVKIIQDWQPDIIHTLGMFDKQGAEFYYEVREQYNLNKTGKWILQLRGGSDLFLRRQNPEDAGKISRIFNACDEIVTDNCTDIEFIKQLGMAHKVAPIAPIHQTWGILDKTDNDNNLSFVSPSSRERMVYWPRAYESNWSKALPIIEAIKLAWDQIKPCTLYITSTDNETTSWLATLPEEIRNNCRIQPGIPRDQMVDIMKRARVMLAPSLLDGRTIELYEAMANGAFPIVSPLETITSLVSDPQNTLFARNLYPQEIANAITKAMVDNQLVDEAVKNNLQLVAKLETRTQISKKVIDYYFSLFRFDKLDQHAPLVSVIIPFYNRINLVTEAVRSVLVQTYRNFEIILVDDGSTESLNSLTEIKDPRIRILRQDNRGPAAARNHGMRVAKGEYIAFLDSDDLFEPDKLMYQLTMLLDHPDVWFAHTSYRSFGEDGDDEIKPSGKFDGSVYPLIFATCPIASPTVMFKREVVDWNIFFEERYRISEDIIFYSKIARFSKFIGIDIPLTRVRKTHSTHASSAKAQIAGSLNILHYLRNSNQDMTPFQRKEVLVSIYKYLGNNYRFQKRLLPALFYDGQVFMVEKMFLLRNFFFKIKTTSEMSKKS